MKWWKKCGSLTKNFYKLQSELFIAKRVNTEFTKRIVILERQS